jgi:hypothetical protein
MAKGKKIRFSGAEINVTNPEMAERHIAAYVYAATGGCDCPACVALRPLAKLFYAKYIEKKKEGMSGGAEAQPSA